MYEANRPYLLRGRTLNTLESRLALLEGRGRSGSGHAGSGGPLVARNDTGVALEPGDVVRVTHPVIDANTVDTVQSHRPVMIVDTPAGTTTELPVVVTRALAVDSVGVVGVTSGTVWARVDITDADHAACDTVDAQRHFQSKPEGDSPRCPIVWKPTGTGVKRCVVQLGSGGGGGGAAVVIVQARLNVGFSIAHHEDVVQVLVGNFFDDFSFLSGSVDEGLFIDPSHPNYNQWWPSEIWNPLQFNTIEGDELILLCARRDKVVEDPPPAEQRPIWECTVVAATQDNQVHMATLTSTLTPEGTASATIVYYDASASPLSVPVTVHWDVLARNRYGDLTYPVPAGNQVLVSLTRGRWKQDPVTDEWSNDRRWRVIGLPPC